MLLAIFSPTVIGDDVKTWNEWDKFFRVHRHLGFDVILIPQSDRLISRKVKCYSEYEVKHFNRKNHGMISKAAVPQSVLSCPRYLLLYHSIQENTVPISQYPHKNP